jgi:hypothetical protein
VVEAVKHFYHYLYGVKFTVRTDHGVLNWLLRFKNPEGQIARWLELLATYNMTVVHRPGKQHGNADGMSRRPCFPCDHCSRQENKELPAEVRALRRGDNENAEIEDSAAAATWLHNATPAQLRDAHMKDTTLAVVLNWKENEDGRPSWRNISACDGTTKAYWSQWDRLHLREGVLYRRWIEQGTNLSR